MIKFCNIIIAIIVFSSLFTAMMQVLTLNDYIFSVYLAWWTIPAKVATVIVSIYVFALIFKFLPFILVIFTFSLILAVDVWDWSLWISILVFIWPVIVFFFYCAINKSLKYNTSDLFGGINDDGKN
ncbi:hypothetical protein BB987_14955 [Photorhabdus temperata]|uniref:Uncharacterized protein n=1 Tax=Photorhabdus khanii NC19 TaxID=1004151 RepID=W3VCY8_9GAMM|nr:hypothetical protein [Photorhabdus khanii]ETS33663.1 hypothetical protein PTE_00839 [Photorhabdus khanii NC19]OHV52246.1 hypothetical protein BB987_14955 [Photorhabdus temperata]